MNALAITLLDIPRILTLIVSVISLFYLVSTAKKYREVIPVLYYLPLIGLLLHEVAFYATYFITNRFETVSDIELLRLWPQLLRFHTVVVITGGVAVFRTGIKRWLMNSIKYL